ncbi:MAG: tRNA lysidine(34) synthetase TilS [bacterium]
MRSEAINKFMNTVSEFDMVSYGDSVLVGVSGGPDSVSLLHMLWSVKDKLKLSLHVGHLDHGMRGKDAGRDARFVRDMADKLGIGFSLKKVSIPTYANKHKMSLEEAARDMRYGFLQEVAKKTGSSKIALGHNCDDQVETVLMWFLRGTGRGGLSGIPPVRKLDCESFIIRPLIDLWRKDIIKYLKEHKLKYCVDLTNKNTDFTRNKIRNKLLPLIRKQYNPNFDIHVRNTTRILRDENMFIADEVDKALERLVVSRSSSNISLDLKGFLKYNLSLGRQVLRRAMKLVSGGSKGLDYTNVTDVISFAKRTSAGSEIQLRGSFVARKSYDTLDICRRTKKDSKKKKFSHSLNIPGVTLIPEASCEVHASVFTKQRNFRYSRGGLKVHVDMDSLKMPLILRCRKNGDRIRPLGSSGYKKLKDFFIDEKVPRQERDYIPIITSGSDIVWVTGYPVFKQQISDNVKLTSKSKKVLEIKLDPLKNNYSKR